MKPSFYTLFRRREREHQRPEEVFAVAAIAFCLKHADDEFSKNFLTKFCEIQAGAESEPEIDADTHKWGDLVIKGHSFVCVLEFKISSEVQSHQNPNSPQFQYAENISEFRDYRDLDKRFIVVTNDEKVEKIGKQKERQNDVVCKWKSWTDLSRDVQPINGSKLHSDLYDCLGDLGISVFRRESYAL